MKAQKHTTQYRLFPVLSDPVTLDAKRGRIKRDQGIKEALDHAVQENPDWKDAAYKILKKYLDQVKGPFMAEDVRQYAADNAFPAPPHNRAWGGIMAKAAIDKLIYKVGIGQVRNEKAHRANAAIWSKTE